MTNEHKYKTPEERVSKFHLRNRERRSCDSPLGSRQGRCGMSADEIKALADLSTPVMPEHWQATVMWPEQWDKIKAAILAYAAMVERCEAEIAKLPYPPNSEDVYWFNKLKYILKGVTNERKG